MIHVSDETLENIIREDVPYLDLTTWLLAIGDARGRIRFFSRETIVVCGTEEAERICAKLKLTVISMKPSGTWVEPDEIFFEAGGTAAGLHAAWKAVMGILEHCSAIATRTRRFVDSAKRANPAIAVSTTRKQFPGTRELSVKAVLAGGALPHRLGLSETVLVFRQHRAFLADDEAFFKILPDILGRSCEKKIVAEAETAEFALRLCRAGIDGIQFDKLTPVELKSCVPPLRAINPKILLLAAGGIHEGNVSDYAATGVDVLVTTSVYAGKPVDMGCKMEPLS